MRPREYGPSLRRDITLLLRLRPFVRRYQVEIGIALLVFLGHTILQLAQPYFVKLAIDAYINGGEVAAIGRIAICFVAALLASVACEYIYTYRIQVTGQRIVADLRLKLYGHVQRLDMQFFDRNPTGQLMTRIAADVESLSDLLTVMPLSMCGNALMLFGSSAVLLWLDWRLALMALCLLPIAAVLNVRWRAQLRDAFRTMRTSTGNISAVLQESLAGMRVIRLFGAERQRIRRMDDVDQTHLNAALRTVSCFALSSPIIEVLAAVSLAIVLWNGAHHVLEGAITVGTLVAFIQYLQRAYRPLIELSMTSNVIQSAIVAAERVFSTLDTPCGIERTAGSQPRRCPAPDHIVFDHVSFAYAGDAEVLRDVSFEIRKGERVGIVGMTGAGKTTIFNLLMRFYDVTDGRILIDGVDIREFNVADLRHMFGVVMQDAHVFSGTIARNVSLGDPAITSADVRRAIRAVGAESFIGRFEREIEHEIDEHDGGLSAGEKQLVSLARIVAFRPQILLLDEATANVDSRTEALLKCGLEAAMASRTIVAIAHRLSTIQTMDKILVLHNGCLHEAGTHQQLMSRRGLYYRLHEIQNTQREQEPCLQLSLA